MKEKTSLSTATVAKAFLISKEQALEWGKILEEHNLASIEYPAFSDPEITIEEVISDEMNMAENENINSNTKSQDDKSKKEENKKK